MIHTQVFVEFACWNHVLSIISYLIYLTTKTVISDDDKVRTPVLNFTILTSTYDFIIKILL
jgi:hypothetical protein